MIKAVKNIIIFATPLLVGLAVAVGALRHYIAISYSAKLFVLTLVIVGGATALAMNFLLEEEKPPTKGVTGRRKVEEMAAGKELADLVRRELRNLLGERYKEIMHRDRKTATGISALDGVLDGGFPQGCVVLLTGPVKVGKTSFCYKYVLAGLERNERVTYVAVDEHPQEIREVIEGFAETDNLTFVDGYSWRVDGESGEKYVVQNLDPAKLLAATLDACNKAERLVFDSLSTLILNNDPETTYKFYTSLAPKLREKNITTIFTLEKEMHPQQTEKSLKQASDIILKLEKGKTPKTRKISAKGRRKKQLIDFTTEFEFKMYERSA